jgi:hypothetical protein
LAVHDHRNAQSVHGWPAGLWPQRRGCTWGRD